MADKKTEKKPVETPEKNAENKKRANKIVMVFFGIIIFALIVSLFTGNKPTPPAAPRDTQDSRDSSGQYSDADSFNTASTTQSMQKGAKSLHHHYRRGTVEPSAWEKKEITRVLDSRRVGFGFEARKNSDSNRPQHVNVGSGTVTTANQRPGRSSLTLSNTQIARLARLFSGKETKKTLGENIVGHAVDNRYPGQVKKGEALIPTGTVINAVLDQDVNSDYTGPWRGILTQDVYSVDNQFILFPKGTQVLGESMHIANVNAPIQNRMGLTVNWMILPNGKRIDFRVQAVEDRSGLSGIGGSVNHHLLAQFTAVGAYALISASMPRDNVNALGVTQNPTFKGQFADGLRDQALPMVTKYLSLVPTVTLHSGTPIKIMIQNDVYTKPWTRVNQTVYEDAYVNR